MVAWQEELFSVHHYVSAREGCCNFQLWFFHLWFGHFEVAVHQLFKSMAWLNECKDQNKHLPSWVCAKDLWNRTRKKFCKCTSLTVCISKCSGTRRKMNILKQVLDINPGISQGNKPFWTAGKWKIRAQGIIEHRVILITWKTKIRERERSLIASSKNTFLQVRRVLSGGLQIIQHEAKNDT